MKDHVFIKANDFELSSSDNLLIELNENSFNYAVVKPDDRSLKALGTANGSVFNQNQDLFSFNFSNIFISTLTKSFTFVPEVFYNDTLEQTFVSFLQADLQSEEVFSSFLDKQNIRNIYALNSSLLEKLNHFFSNARISTQINPLYEGCLFGKIAEVNININIKDEHFELLIIRNNQLDYYNIFEFKNNDEILYFSLLTLQQKGLKVSHISASGKIDESSDLFLKLKESFHSIELNTPTGILNIGEEFKQANLHHYFSLLSLHLCV